MFSSNQILQLAISKQHQKDKMLANLSSLSGQLHSGIRNVHLNPHKPNCTSPPKGASPRRVASSVEQK